MLLRPADQNIASTLVFIIVFGIYCKLPKFVDLMKSFSFVKGWILCAQLIGHASEVLRARAQLIYTEHAICPGLGIVPDWIVKRVQVARRGTCTFQRIDSRRLIFKLKVFKFCIFQKGSKVKTKIYIALNLKSTRNEQRDKE